MANATNIDIANNKTNANNAYLKDSQDAYLLDKLSRYLTTTDIKENENMPNTKKYVSLSKLTKYDELLKAKMAADDAKVLADAKAHAEGLASNYEAAGAVKTAKQELQGNIDALANGQVATNKADIAKLNGDANTAGSVAKAVADSAATLQASINAVDGKADQNATDIGVLEGKVEALEKGTYDDAEVRGLISDNTEAIGTLGQTHATDKKALEDAIALKADQTSLDGVSAVANAAATKTALEAEVKTRGEEITRVEGLVTAEAQRATGVENDFKGRIETMEAFWKAAQADGTDSNVIDTLKEIQEYIAGDETGAGEMLASIQANAKAIEDMDKAYKEADTTLQGNIDKKADSSVVEALDGRVGKLETASATHALKTEVEAVSGALTQYQNAHAGDYTNAQVDSAIETAVGAEAERVDAEIAKKVDKVAGKGLSTNDLTNELKGNYDVAYAHSQVAHAPANAQANIIESVKVNGTALTVTGKAVDITVPTKVSELTNDVPYLVASDIANKADKATTLAGYGIADAYTSVQTDTAIANAMAQFVEVSEQEILDMFK